MEAASSGLPLYRIQPPYRHFQSAQLSPGQPPGTVLGLLISNDTAAHVLRQQVKHVTRIAPNASLIGAISTRVMSVKDAMSVASNAGDAGLPLVALDEKDIGLALRAAVTRLNALHRLFKQWLRDAGVTADERLIGLFGRMLEQAAAQAETDPFLPAFLDESPHWTVDSMAEIVGVKAMTLRSLCSRNQLPTPGRWRTFCRLMVHALVLQRHPERTLTRHAIVLGYSASQDLSHAFQAGFGVTPSHVQERLGWQWLGWKWVTTRKRL